MDKSKGMSLDMYNFLISIQSSVKYDLDQGLIFTASGSNGKVYNANGYLRFKKGGKLLQVHQFLAVLYFGEKCIGMQINHIDGNKLNNKKENLEPISRVENIQHQWGIGLGKTPDNNIKVNQYDMNWNFIKTHDSMKLAAEYVGLKSTSNISSMCKGNLNRNGNEIQSVGGYKWKFTN